MKIPVVERQQEFFYDTNFSTSDWASLRRTLVLQQFYSAIICSSLPRAMQRVLFSIHLTIQLSPCPDSYRDWQRAIQLLFMFCEDLPYTYNRLPYSEAGYCLYPLSFPFVLNKLKLPMLRFLPAKQIFLLFLQFH